MPFRSRFRPKPKTKLKTRRKPRFAPKFVPRLGSSLRRSRPRGRIKEDFGDFTHPSLSYRAPRSLKVYRAGMAAILSIAIVVGGWSFYWVMLAGVVKKQATEWVENQNTTGAEVRYEDLSMDGFPTRVHITFTNPVYGTSPKRKSGFRWSGERLSLSVGTLSPMTLRLEGAGRFRLLTHWPGKDGSVQTMRYRGRVKELGAELEIGPYWPKRLGINLSGLTLRGGTGDGGGARVGAERFKLELGSGSNGQALDINLDGHTLALPWAVTAPLAPDMQHFELALSVTGPVNNSLQAWQAAGGKAKVKSLVVKTEGATLAAAGDMVLDKNLQPSFQLVAKVGGLLPLINRLRDQGYVRDRDAVLVKMTLAALSRREASGRTVLNINIKGHGGDLYLGPVRVGPVPMVDWSVLE